MSITLTIDKNKKFDVVAIGAWTVFDHIAKIERYPNDGDTIEIIDGNLEDVFFGDCSLNVAAVASTLGSKVAVASVVGSDFRTSGYEQHLLDLGVDVSGIHVVEDAKSGHSYIFFDDDGRGFCLSLRAASLVQNEVEPPLHILEDCSVAVINEAFSSYVLSSARAAKSAGAVIFSNGMLGTAEPEALDEFLQLVDVMIINEAEFKVLCEGKGVSAESIFAHSNLQAVIVTQGSRGSTVLDVKGGTFIPAVPPRRVVDTTGAGDSFTGGVVSAVVRGLPLVEAVQIGASVSSIVIEEWGCQTNIPTWQQAVERSNQHRVQI